MRFSLPLLAIGLTLVAAGPRTSQRIVGGSVTTISQYPFSAALLYTRDGTNFLQNCGGTILNNRSILSAAHCFFNFGNGTVAHLWRIRVGSTYANSGGVVHITNQVIMHPDYDHYTENNDIAILRAIPSFAYNDNVRPGSIAGPNYNLADNEVVWAIGWGAISFRGPRSEELRHVQVWTVNQQVCNELYDAVDVNISDNMLCSGWVGVGGRDQCQGDSGSPLLHHNVVVGLSSWGFECARPDFPGVNARVSRYTAWIQSNA